MVAGYGKGQQPTRDSAPPHRFDGTSGGMVDASAVVPRNVRLECLRRLANVMQQPRDARGRPPAERIRELRCGICDRG
jgi:hypothetical protein